jgi:allantoinase
MDTFTDLTKEQMLLAAGYVEKTKKPLAVHAEDKQIINSAGVKHTGEELKSWEAYCGTRTVLAEAEAVLKMVNIAGKTDCKVHIVHLSSEAGLDLIKNAQKRDLRITAETCPHYLYFTQESFRNESIRNYLKTAPPVKCESDKNALWDGLAEGSIAFITTDHAGCNPGSEKSDADFSKVYGGIPGVEHRVPFLFSEGFLKRELNLEQTIRLLSSGAADYFGFNKKGYLKENYDADIALINLWSSEIVSASNMHSKGKYTPFEGVRFNAVVEKTFLRGNLIMDRLISSSDTKLNLNQLFSGRFIYV